MNCQKCKKEINNVPDMDNETLEYFGTVLTTFEYTLTCEHCGQEHEIDHSDYYEGLENGSDIEI